MPYTKTSWLTGDTITALKLNNIEQGVYDAHTLITDAKHYYINLLSRNTSPDGDTTISVNTNLDVPIKYYNNLTINNGVTLTCNKPLTIIFVKGTLTLNGTISAVGKGGVGGSKFTGVFGGNGGGIVIVYVKQLTGTGTINVSGTNGANGSMPATSASAQTDGGFCGDVCAAGASPSSSTGGLGGTGLGFLATLFSSSFMGLSAKDNGGGGGGPGSADHDSSDGQYGPGGGGGAGVYGNGGNGGNGGDRGDGGCGGGGAGAIVVCCENAVPSINLLAQGGNGGNAGTVTYLDGGGGGGGGGGFINIMAPSSTAVTNVVGGIGGNAGGGTGVAGSAGSAGLALLTAI